jgi:uncharacterized protein YjbI with pentapeptide repeats
MPLNFSGKNLQGRSFRDMDLTGANFSAADIRGADFTQAILLDANFSDANAGLPQVWRWQLTLLVLLLSLLSGCFAIFVIIFVGYLLFPYSLQPASILAPLLVLGFGLILAVAIGQRGFGTAFSIGVLAGIVLGALVGSISGTINGMVAGAIVVTALTAVSIVTIRVWTQSIAIARILTGIGAAIVAAMMMIVGGAIGAKVGIIFALEIAKVIAANGVSVIKMAAMEEAVMASMLGCATAASLSSYVSGRAIAGDQKFIGVWQWAIAFTTMGGTRFRNANLTNANFTQANLKNTDFQQAELTHTNFHCARNLNQAVVKNTILADQAVQKLVVTYGGQDLSYAGRNLQGAYLPGANLSGADLTEADISAANLTGADLEQANLTKVHAIATNLQQTRLTGACIEAWNIDSTTILDDVVCDYVYLRHHQQERRPSSGDFAPGDFAELFQEIIHTLDLLFRNGIDQKAFNYSLYQLQVENDGLELSIQSLEKKSNGTLIVRMEVPENSDKGKLHSDFFQSYELALQAIASQYQEQLQAKDEQIDLYRQQQADWQVVLQLLENKASLADNQNNTPAVGKIVLLHIGSGSPKTGFAVTLQIGAEQLLQSLQFTKGRLAPVIELFNLYDRWRLAYRQCFKTSFRLDIPDTQITNVSRQDLFYNCCSLASQLEKSLNNWLNDAEFRPIKERMLEQLAPTETIRIVMQTDDLLLRRLPFQLWDFLQRYPRAEISLSQPSYERVESWRPSRATVQILAILGDSQGIDIQRDRALLTQLPQAEITFLVEPDRQSLTDQLWRQPWDIMFFAGHSSTSQDSDLGFLSINPQDRLSIDQLKHGLKKAISQGLKLAIFNSCDCLGLVNELADLHIPYLIVMREPVPDYVAQEFLKNFLTSFASGQPLHLAVREAREKLQGLEDRFPCATWLPIVCQNPSAPALAWQDFQGSIYFQ